MNQSIFTLNKLTQFLLLERYVLDQCSHESAGNFHLRCPAYDRHDFDLILTIYRMNQKLKTLSNNPFSKHNITSQNMENIYCMTSIL